MALYQVFADLSNEGATRQGGLKSRHVAIRYATRLPASANPTVRTLDNRLVWMRTPAGEAVDLEAPDAFQTLAALTPSASPAKAALRPAKARKAAPGSLASQCQQPRQPKARPTWAQIEAAHAEAQARTLRYEHFKKA